MGASRIEQLIEDIYEFVESCRVQILSSNKVVVPKDELYDLLDELRLRTPDEIKRYQKIISNRDAIIADAEEKAQTIVAQAKESASSLINDHEIMQQAYYQAQEIVNQAAAEADQILYQANADADAIRQGALDYTKEMLGDVENILTNAYENTRTRFDNILDSLKGNLDIVQNNLHELAPEELASEAAASGEENEAELEEENMQQDAEDYNFDENTFIDNIEQ